MAWLEAECQALGKGDAAMHHKGKNKSACIAESISILSVLFYFTDRYVNGLPLITELTT